MTCALMAIFALGFAAAAAAQSVVRTQQADFIVETVAGGFDAPWSVAFLPEGDVLVTERPGRLLRVSAGGRVTEIPGGPRTREIGQGGLMDVALAPDFATSGVLFLSYAGFSGGEAETRLARARFAGDRLVGLETVWAMDAPSRGGRHFGGRLAFGSDGALYLTIGDRGQRNRAQDPADPAGSVLRFTADGVAHPDNPFGGAVYTIGNRNPQGLALRPADGALWSHEHGPRGGDEVNRIRGGVNYGWPVITYGQEYSGGPVGAGLTEAPGMAQPDYVWTPSIAPSGMAFYDGDAFPEWRGDLFVGALVDRALVRLEMEGDRIVDEERMLAGVLGRIRDVRLGPDGALYLLTDSSNGALVRLKPAG